MLNISATLLTGDVREASGVFEETERGGEVQTEETGHAAVRNHSKLS